MNSTVERWSCPTCRTVIVTAYCPVCGEQRPHSRDLTFRGLFAQALEAFTSLDARVLRTLRGLAFSPGSLTNFYREGPRKPYIGPFALFLLTNVLFVAMEAVTGSNIFATPLHGHLHTQPWSELMQGVIADRVATRHSTMELYAPVFDLAVAAKAKSLIVLMVVPFALLQAAVFRRAHAPFAVHLAFSLHFFAFLLLTISVALIIPAVDLIFGGAGLASQLLDDSISIGLLVACAAYLWFATEAVYATSGASRIFKVVLLLSAAIMIFLGYRFLLLIVVLYTT